MYIKTVWAAYFSATQTTKKTVEAIAGEAAQSCGAAMKCWDWTLPQARTEGKAFSEEDVVIFGTPVYAGRVPNVLLGDFERISGGGAMAVAVCSYGNRHYDDALIELRDLLERRGFRVIAAAAFIGEHSFSQTLAAGRPDKEDLRIAKQFGARAAALAASLAQRQDGIESLPKLCVPGTEAPYRGYYRPQDRSGNFIDIRSVKPLTSEACNACGLCAKLCPMGSIALQDVRQFTGICIKCGACIKRCPQKARYYDDSGYLYHKEELEEGLKRRAEPELFFSSACGIEGE